MRAAALPPLILSVIFALLSAPHPQAQTPGTGRLSGRVTNTAVGHLPGVTITLEGHGAIMTAITDADGRFFITRLAAPETYAVTASLPGFETVQREVRLAPDVSGEASTCVVASEVEASLLADSRNGQPRPLLVLLSKWMRSRYRPGDEVVAALYWNKGVERYGHWTPGAPVVNGVATLDDSSVSQGFERTMPVGPLLDRLERGRPKGL